MSQCLFGQTSSHALVSCLFPESHGHLGMNIIHCAVAQVGSCEMVEGKDHPWQLGQPQYDNLGSTVGLLLQILTPTFFKGFIMILDSGFCVLKGIVELRKKGVFASSLTKKRWYWPQFICGDEIKEHFDNKQVGDTDLWAGWLGGWMTSLCHERA